MSAVTYVGNPSACHLAAKVDAALRQAVAKIGLDPDSGIYGIDGMSANKYRFFINTLVRSLDDARYLEVGSWLGSTLCSAVHGNKVKAAAIDNWSEFGGSREGFMNNLENFMTPDAHVTLVEADFRKVDFSRLPGMFNIYLFDGPHEAEDQYLGLEMALPCLDERFVFIVDDWNWRRVRDGTFAAITKCGLKIMYGAAIRTTGNDMSPAHLLPIKDFRSVRDFDWHNGYFISVLGKVATPIT